MATKLFPTSRITYVYVVIKSHNKKIGNELVQFDEIIGVHKTHQGAEDKIESLRPTTPTRSFTRFQIRKLVLSK